MGLKVLILLPQQESDFERKAKDKTTFGLFESHVWVFIKNEEITFSRGAAWLGEKIGCRLASAPCQTVGKIFGFGLQKWQKK